MKFLDAAAIGRIIVNDDDIDRMAVLVMHAYHPTLCFLADLKTDEILPKVRHAYALAAVCLAAKSELVNKGLDAIEAR